MKHLFAQADILVHFRRRIVDTHTVQYHFSRSIDRDERFNPRLAFQRNPPAGKHRIDPRTASRVNGVSHKMRDRESFVGKCNEDAPLWARARVYVTSSTLSRFPFPGFSARPALATPSLPLFSPDTGDLPGTFFYSRDNHSKSDGTQGVSFQSISAIVFELYSSFKKCLNESEYLFSDRTLHPENFQQEDTLGSLGSV